MEPALQAAAVERIGAHWQTAIRRRPQRYSAVIVLLLTAILTSRSLLAGPPPAAKASTAPTSADSSAAAVGENNAADVIPISFQMDNGWWYDGRIELPPKDRRRDWAVMLLGGGTATDIDWLVDGIMTLDGNPTHDADTITSALLDRGFVVMRWKAIRRDDPIHAKDPLMIDPPTFDQTLEQTRRAFAAFVAKNAVPTDHIFLLGHSLGAFRAAMLVAKHKDLPGVVMLAGASLIPTRLDELREVVAGATRETGGESAGADVTKLHQRILDAVGQRRQRWAQPLDATTKRHGVPWPAYTIVTNQTPTLLLVGTLDERWLVESYAFTDYLREHHHPNYTWRVYEGLGHQLGRERAGDVHHPKYGVIAKSRTGPIDPHVVDDAVNWIERRAR